MDKYIKNIKIFVYATFLGAKYWRVRYDDGAISKLGSLSSMLDIYFYTAGRSFFIDYDYAQRFF